MRRDKERRKRSPRKPQMELLEQWEEIEPESEKPGEEASRGR